MPQWRIVCAAARIGLMSAVQCRDSSLRLGQGVVPLTEIIRSLEHSRPDLWYVLEQDAALSGPGAEDVERLRRGVAQSLQFVQDFDLAR